MSLNNICSSYRTTCKSGNGADGFTLIEVLIAMFILLIGMLALMNTSAVMIHNNFANILRDDAVGVATEQMNIWKNTPNLTARTSSQTITREVRGMTSQYTVTSTITLAGGNALDVIVTVSWTYGGKNYSHSISTVIYSG